MNDMTIFFSGAIMIGSASIALFFLKFWSKTRDGLFLHFSVAFVLFAIERCVLVLVDPLVETRYYVYMFRLAGFVVIAKAIFDKNLRDV